MIRMKIFTIITLLVLCCTTPRTNAKPGSPLQAGPPSHYEDWGACPFECCTYRSWTVLLPTAIYKQRVETSPVAFRAVKGERVTGVTGLVITTKAGKAVVEKVTTLGEQRQKVTVKRGDALYLLHYEGEGFYKIWFGGRIYSAQLDDGDAIRKVSEPQTVWWVKVKNRRGQVGWSKQTKHFGNMDACG